MSKKRKPLAFLTALCLSFSLFAFSLPASAAEPAPGNTSAEPPSSSIGGSVYSGTLSYSSATDSAYTGTDYESTYFAYIPDCANYGERATASPILLVYPEEALVEEVIEEVAIKSGLAEIADAERAPVIFINPSSSAGWTAADITSLVAAKSLFSDSTNTEYTAGEGKSSGGMYPGAYGRIYTFAFGAGADFAYEHLASGVVAKGQFFASAVWKPTSLFLMDADSTASVDLASGTGRDLPVYIVNGNETISDAFEALNSSASMTVSTTGSSESLGRDALLKGYDSLMEHWFLRDMGGVHSLLTIDDYDLTGIVHTRNDYDAGGSQPLTYYSYVPTSASGAGAGTMPLFVIFHGNGSSAENIVYSSGIDKLAASEGFMVISLDDHNKFTNAQLMEAVKSFVAANPQVDSSRIYMGGFSMGSMKTASLTTDYGSYFAGAVLMNGFSSPTMNDNAVVMPVFAIGGNMTHIQAFEFPSATSYAPCTYFFTVNGVDDSFVFDSAYTWGKQPSLEVVTAATDIVEPPLSLTTHYFESTDGNTYTAFATAATAGHEPTLVATTEAWNFIKQFSRRADGGIAIEGVSGLVLTADKKFVANGEYFEIAAKMVPDINSNAATLTFKYNPDKFIFHKFDAVDGLTVISTEHDAAAGTVSVTLGNLGGYGMAELGTALFQAREDVQLKNEKLPIHGSISYVLLENGDKTIKGAFSSIKIGTRGLLGDTNNDGVVDLIDLSNMIDWFGLTEDAANWDQIDYFDFNENGKIDISDVAKVASLIK